MAAVDIERVFQGLADLGEKLQEADARRKQAQTDYEMALTTFTSIRDMATKHVGFPWLKGNFTLWPNYRTTADKWRFAHMQTGDAVLVALAESGAMQGGSEVSIQGLIAALIAGGADPDDVNSRSVTAAISRYVQSGKVIEVDEGKYQLAPEQRGGYTRGGDVNPEDLPFE